MNAIDLEVPQIAELEVVTREAQALVPVDKEKTEIVETIKDVLTRMEGYKAYSESLVIHTQEDFDTAGIMQEKMADDIKAVEAVTKPWSQRAFQFHRRITGLVGLVVKPAQAYYGKTTDTRNAWLRKQREKAEKDRAEAQQIADEKAQREREALAREAEELRKKAENAKRQDTKDRALAEMEAKREQAAAVSAPVISVEAPKITTGRTPRTQWYVKSYDMTEMGIPEAVQGYVTVEEGKLQRAKAANTMLKIPGVVFDTRLV